MNAFGEISFVMFIFSVLAGYSLGVFSGLVPGIHTNNFALILLAFSPALSEHGIPVFYVAVMILSNSVAHTFHDVIPAIFLGAPSDDMALAVLPGHTLLLEGRGAEAIRLSALGSAGSVAFAMVIALPLSMLFKTAYSLIQSYLAWILIFIVVIMILTEKGEYVPGQGSLVQWKFKFYALLIFLISGFLGVLAFNTEYMIKPIFSLGEPSILLPLLSGLFGSSQLIISLMSSPVVPAQLDHRLELGRKSIFRGIFVGGLSGSLVAWLPGISSSVATVFARLFIRQEPKKELEICGQHADEKLFLDPAKEFIVSVSGVNTCNAIFALVALAVIGKSRNGAMVVVDGLLGGVELDAPSMLLFFCAVSLTAIFSYFSTIYVGDKIHTKLSDINYPLLCYAVIAILSLIVLFFTGIFGLVIFAISTSVGMLAPFLKVRKSNSMGVILLPVILYFL
ncbi:tripartite tricarboxylate transporter permease [Methanolobus sp. ZRKC2]|uniref:tripartite tricarboxylate transporter permease n=1 Tax=Methanolobus sp. ZRKC2 TaxID=3125783 RepID=UPI00324C2DAE